MFLDFWVQDISLYDVAKNGHFNPRDFQYIAILQIFFGKF